MDYKQKYEEALERAREVHRNEDDKVSTMEFLFPELAEREDEKTRKEIVGYLKKNLRLEWATWLEKQWQNPAWTEADDEEFNKVTK